MTRPCNPRAEASPPAKRALLEQDLSGNAGAAVPPPADMLIGAKAVRPTRGAQCRC